MKRFSPLKKQIDRLFDPSLNMEFCCYSYPMRSERGSTSIPRFCVKQIGLVIWDCPKNISIPEQYIHVWSDRNGVNDLVREYINTPIQDLLENEFENENWEYNDFKITYGLTDIFKAGDRRLGQKKLYDWAEKLNNPTVDMILEKRFRMKQFAENCIIKTRTINKHTLNTK